MAKSKRQTSSQSPDRSPRAIRALAFVIDYLLGGAISLAPAIVAYNRATGGKTLRDLGNLVEAGFSVNQVGLFVAAMVGLSFAYYVIVPWKLMPGQTLGKRFTRIEVVMNDGSPAGLGVLTLRWAFMTLIETHTTLATVFLAQYVTLLSGSVAPMTFWLSTGLGITVISAVIAWRGRDHTALHDKVAGTWVYTDPSER